MPSHRKVYHVIPNANRSRWVVNRESDSSFREEFDTKEAAVDAAKSRARGEIPSQVKVHLANGNMEYESTYGEDPAISPR